MQIPWTCNPPYNWGGQYGSPTTSTSQQMRVDRSSKRCTLLDEQLVSQAFSDQNGPLLWNQRVPEELFRIHRTVTADWSGAEWRPQPQAPRWGRFFLATRKSKLGHSSRTEFSGIGGLGDMRPSSPDLRPQTGAVSFGHSQIRDRPLGLQFPANKKAAD
jgi:hypothetical protein